MPPKAVNALEGIDVMRISNQLILAAQKAALAEKVPEKKGPETRSGTVFRRVGGVKKSWKEITMSLESSSVGVCLFSDGGEICVRQALIDVPWVFEERVGQKFYFSITDVAKAKAQEVLLVTNPAELEKWLNALETHGGNIHKFTRFGQMSFLLSNSKKKEEGWFVLYPDCLQIYKQKHDQKPYKQINIGEANEFERMAEGFYLAESGDELANGVTCICLQGDVGAWGDEVEKVVLAKRQKKCFDSIKEGYLIKCNADMKFWKKRFCVLMPDHIKYFKKRSDEQPAGTISLPPGAEAEDMEESNNGGTSGENPYPHMFWVAENGDETGTRRYCLSAQSVKEKEAWLHALYTLFAHNNFKQHPLSLHEGYLYHLLPIGNTNIKTGKWSKQFFVLMKDSLMYFKKRTDPQPLGVIDMTQNAEFSAPFLESEVISESLILTIAENGDEQGTYTHYIRAIDEKIRNIWMRAIEGLLKEKENKVHMKSVKEGYMYKQNTHQKWNKRYFILLDDKLSYYKKRQDKNEAGEIPLPGSGEITCMTGDDPNYKWMFTIAESGDEAGVRTYYVACATEALRTQWVNVLTKIIKAKDSRILMGSLLEGYLWKCPDGGGTWRKRYFVLNPNQLLYFRKRADPSSAGCIEIKGEAQVMMIDDDNEHPYCFSVAKSGDEGVREVKIYAPDAVTREEWVRCLRQQISLFAVKIKADSIREGYVNLWTTLGWRRKFFILEKDGGLKLYSKRHDTSYSSYFLLDEKSVVLLQDNSKNSGSGSGSSSGSAGGSSNSSGSSSSSSSSSSNEQKNEEDTVTTDSGEKKLPSSPSFENKENKENKESKETGGEGEEDAGVSSDHKSSGASILLCKNGDTNARRIQLKTIYDSEANFVFDAMNICLVKEFAPLSFLSSTTTTTSSTSSSQIDSNSSSNSNSNSNSIGFTILKSGYISVRYKATGGLNKTDRWIVSYVTLACDDFFVYKSRDDEFPIFSVGLDIAAMVYAGPIPGTATWNPLCITLRDSTEREISFVAQTPEEKNSWMGVIQRSIDLFKEKRRPNKIVLFGGELKLSFSKTYYYNMPSVLAACIDFLKKISSASSIFSTIAPSTTLTPATTTATTAFSYCLLRMPGSHPLVRSFIQDFECCLDVSLSDPESVCACLRLYLVMLKKPILSEHITQQLFAVLLPKMNKQNNSNNGNLSTDREILSRFQQIFLTAFSPSENNNENFVALTLILRFLVHEIKRPEEIHLTPERVAPVWAPLLMRFKEENSNSSGGGEEQQKVSEADLGQQVLLILLKNIQLFFPGDFILVHKLSRKQVQKIKTENATVLNYELLRGCNYGKELFGRFVKDNHIEEDVLFLAAVQRYKELCENNDSVYTQRLARGLEIYNTFVKQGAETQVNVSDSVSKMILERLEGKNAIKNLIGNEFFEAEGQAVLLINTNSWPRFKQSEAYEHWITYREQLKQRPIVAEDPDAAGGTFLDFADRTPTATPRGSPRPSFADAPPPPPPDDSGDSPAASASRVETTTTTTPITTTLAPAPVSASSSSSLASETNAPNSPPEKAAPRVPARQAPVGRAPSRPVLQSTSSLSSLGTSDIDSPPSVSMDLLARAQSAELSSTSHDVFDDLPPPPPDASEEVWFVRKTTKGVSYYIHTVSKATTYKAPEDALIFSCHFDAEGRQCFTSNKDSAVLFEVPECLREFAKTYKLW